MLASGEQIVVAVLRSLKSKVFYLVISFRNKMENISPKLLPECRPYISFSVAILVSVYPETITMVERVKGRAS